MFVDLSGNVLEGTFKREILFMTYCLQPELQVYGVSSPKLQIHKPSDI